MQLQVSDVQPLSSVACLGLKPHDHMAHRTLSLLTAPCEDLFWGDCGSKAYWCLFQSVVGLSAVIVSPCRNLRMLLVSTNLIAFSRLLEIHTIPLVGPDAIIISSCVEL